MRYWVWIGLLIAVNCRAATHYVAPTNPAAAPPYTSWATAGTNIIDVVNAAMTNSAPRVVWVTNGNYYPTNRIFVTNVMTIQSVNGRDATIFHGGAPLYKNQCAVFIVDSPPSVFDGFTVSNYYGTNHSSGAGGAVFGYGLTVRNCLFIGNTNTAGSGINVHGGGLHLRDYGTVSNCIFKNNYAKNTGGGLYADEVVSALLPRYTITGCRFEGNYVPGLGGAGYFSDHNVTVSDCVIVSNSCGDYGGGLYFSAATNIFIRNCLIASNRVAGGSPKYGGGIYFAANTTGRVESCSIVSNYAGGAVGGLYSASVSITGINNIIYYNTSLSAAYVNFTNAAGNTGLNYSCVIPAVNGSGNITNDPGLKDIAGGDYSLRMGSPCINTGINQDWMTNACDLVGNRRIMMSVVDMGACESPPPAMTTITFR